MAHRLDLRIDRPGNYPVVTVLIDGADLLTEIQDGFHGFDPAEMLGPESPLCPLTVRQRVAIYRCSCGIAGCGVIAPTIRRRDGDIVWADFRDYTGVFNGPTVDQLEVPGGRRLDQPALVFDADQYLAEVRRAVADRSWESPDRQTARLVAEAVVDHHIDWAMPRGDIVEVSITRGGRQRLYELTAPVGRPADRARIMVAGLISRLTS